jgi:putative transposase
VKKPLYDTSDAARQPPFLPGHIWHITHRCHQRKFLLKFARDRRCYLHWVFDAKKRFGLSVLNYMITSNHVHLLIKDTGPNGNVTQAKAGVAL